MDLKDYQTACAKTECNQEDSRRRAAGSAPPVHVPHEVWDASCDRLRPIRILHAALGCAKQAGELIRPVQKWIYYGAPLDAANIVEELGDLFWYMAEMCNALGIDMNTIPERNLAKLKVRYPEGFTKEQALNRDTDEERRALMGDHSALAPLGMIEAGPLVHEAGHAVEVAGTISLSQVLGRPLNEEEYKAIQDIAGTWADPETPTGDRSGT